MRFAIALLLLASFVFPLAATPAPASAAVDCQFVLGFGALRSLVPTVVGECLENEHHNAFNGDAVQRTSTGLLVWRKAGNFTAFTDGYRTWINGPKGLQMRLNNQRFTWERDLVDLQVQRAGFAQSGPTVAFAVVVENRNESYAIENVPLTITAFDAADKPLAVQNSVIRVVLPAQTRGIAGTLAVPADAKVTRIEGKIEIGRAHV